jgi:hypothetical protein
MPRDATSVLYLVTRTLADGKLLIGYTAFLFCGRVMPVVWAGFGVQLLTVTAPDVLLGWGLEPRVLAAPLAMAPAGLLLGVAIGRAGGDRVDPIHTLVWSGLAASLATGATALAGTPAWLAAGRLLASTASGLSIWMASRLASRLIPAGHLLPVSAVTATLLAVGCLLATWLSGTGLGRDWRALFAAAGLASLAWPLGLLLFRSSAAAPQFPVPKADAPGDPPVPWGPRIFGTRGMLGALIGAPHARETLSLFAVACLNALVGGMALLLMPLVLAQSGSSRPEATTALWMLSAAAIAGPITGVGLMRLVRDRWALRALIAMSAAAAWTLAARRGVASPVATGAALIVCGVMITGAQVIAMRLAGGLGPPGAHAAVVSATTAFTALGALLGPYTGLHAWTAGGLSGFFAAWACCLSLAAVAAAVLPAGPSRLASSRAKPARASGVPA